MKDKLRIFVADNTPLPQVADDMVRLKAGDVITFLAEASRGGDAWLKDFEDDQIALSRDLYDVLMAYRYYHRESA
ncbi:MAG: hypothetical protein NXI22_23845 [bacterium]|nr:hypothetical protein [bacterium]